MAGPCSNHHPSLGIVEGCAQCAAEKDRPTKHGERVRGEDIGRPKGWYVRLVCADCGVQRYAQAKSNPYAERCQACNIAKKKREGWGF